MGNLFSDPLQHNVRVVGVLISTLENNGHCCIEATLVILVAENEHVDVAKKAGDFVDYVLFGVTDDHLVADIGDFEVVVDSFYMKVEL